MGEDCSADPKGPAHEEKETVTESCCEFHPPTRCGPAKCPKCGALGKSVKRITLGALLKPDRRVKIPLQDEFCFCPTSSCDVVYFLPGKTLFYKEDLSIKVWTKEPNEPTVPVCYCFNWTLEKIQAEIAQTAEATVVDQIKAQVQAGNCYCEVTNPQGSCCLGNMSQVVKQALTAWKSK